MRTPLLRASAALVVAGLVTAACGSGESALDAGRDATTTAAATTTEPADTTAPATSPGATDPAATTTEPAETTAPTTTLPPIDQYPACPTGALDGVTTPVEITYWHGMTDANERALQAVVDGYHAGQSKVRVTLQNQGGYQQAIDKYYASESGRPDLIMFPEYGFQRAIDSGTFVPAEACLRDSGYDTSAVLPGPIRSYAQSGVQWGLPFNVSDVLMYYSRTSFTAAGLDPDSPPATFDELRAALQALVDTGVAPSGLAYDVNFDGGGGWYIEQWFANSGADFVDNGNGRTATATEVLLTGETGVRIYTELQGLADDGLLYNVGDNPSGYDTFLRLADPTAPAAIAFGTSAVLGTMLSILGAGQIAGVGPDDIGVGPMPTFSGEPSAVIGGAANYIVAGHGDDKTAAAWDFATYLLTPEVQSQWAAATGYIPIVEGATGIEPLTSVYADDPRFRVAFDQLAASPDDSAHAGAVIGPHKDVRQAMADALALILTGADVQATLADAKARADALLANYASLNQ